MVEAAGIESTERHQSFARAFAGVGAMAILTYMGEYAAFIIVLVYLSDKFTVQFQMGTVGYALVGTISGVFLIASGLAAIYMGHLCDLYGRRRMMIIGCLVGAVSLSSLIVANSFSQLVPFAVATAASMVTLAMAHGTYTAATLAYGGDLAEVHQTMGKAYGLVDGAEFAGYAFGPALGSTVAFLLRSRTDVFEMSTSLLLVSAVLAVFFMPEVRHLVQPRGEAHHDEPEPASAHSHAHVHDHSASWRDYLAAFKLPIVGVALLTTFVGAVGFSAFFTFVPLYAHFLQGIVPPFSFLYGYFASIMAVSGILFMVPFGHFVDRRQRRMPYLVAGLVAAAASLLLVAGLQATVESFILASVTFGLSIGAVRVGQLVILAESSHPSNRAAVMGTNHAMEHVGYGVAAILAGTLVAYVGGFVSAFRFLSLILLLAGLAFLLYSRKARVK
ncbi:MAG: MFS transporter [Nitrososphaerota archaeon]|nr:MFS transporter [Nitrososphaerota archaeon]MDG6966746.1 MFS transporter [Nitrososphaerota archaeon]MDG6979193.1 MFS transporter [Nitrososphaerota archaeon]MDG7005689.1 MFS transporter [Nitrososphaerota archaeon]MDG7021005.1 MFS transporter [Nitrososphaerota archaeon]